MSQVFASAGRYIQGPDEIERLYEYLKKLGTKFLLIGTKSRLSALNASIQKAFSSHESSMEIEYFNGECTKKEVNRLVEIARAKECNCIVGIGAGKVIDTAKGVAFYGKFSCAIVPTAASSDAPLSALSVYYHDDGVLDEVVIYDKNPDIIIVDTNVIVGAGTRLLAAGIGDALATYFEARGCIENFRDNFVGGKFTNSSWELAKLCYRLLLESGTEAMAAVKIKQVTKAVDDVIEANTLLSGLGFESNGVTGAHSVYYGFTVLPSHEKYLHGEFVAFGTICLLVLENRPSKEIDEVIRFCMSVGLPTTLEDLEMDKLTDDEMDRVATKATADVETIHNEPFIVTKELVKAAILTADQIGLLYKTGKSIL